MKKKCIILNPLQRDGTNQNQRLVRALHPSYVSVDEREIDDLLMYAREFAKLIRYHNSSNERDGDWSLFIENDISTLVSIILNKELEGLKTTFDLAYQKTASGNIVVKHGGIKDQFTTLFNLFTEIDYWYNNSVKGLGLQASLKVKILSSFNESLRNTLSLCGIFREGIGEDACVADVSSFNDIWNTENIEDSSLVDSPALLNTDPALLDEFAKELKKIFEKMFQELREIQDAAPGYLEETLNDYPEHQPYMALFLAFLNIFMYARNHLNSITRRHLDFYYQDVLQLESAPENPDQVHIIFELAKSFQTHLIEQGIFIKDGKDNNGAEILFAADDELVVNKAKIDEKSSFKSIFIDKGYESQNPGKDTPYIIKNIYAATMANSLDGLGTDLEGADGKWQAFGDEKMPYAEVGFAIASPILQLTEGKRMVTFTFEFDDPQNTIFQKNSFYRNWVACELKNNVKVQFSGEKEWVAGTVSSVGVVNLGQKKGQYIFKVELGADGGPVVNYDDKVLAAGFKTNHPVARFIMDNEGLNVLQLQGSFEPLQKFDEVDGVGSWLANRALAFLNDADSAEDIAGREPQVGPVVDHPGTGYGDQVDDYDIGITVAQRILVKRASLGPDGFTNLMQLDDVKGFGIDKLNDLLFSSDCADVENIRSNASTWDDGTEFNKNDYVFFEDGFYRSRILNNIGFRPDVNPDQWQSIEKSYPYRFFRPLEFLKLSLRVDVTGVKNLVIENDVGTLNPAKPFMPFGPVPKVGSCFYLGSQEVFKKCLSGPVQNEIKVNLKWTDLPENSFNNHYANYKYYNGTTYVQYFAGNNDHFKTDIEVLHGNEWGIAKSNQTLFNTIGTDLKSGKTFELDDILTDRNTKLEPFGDYGLGFERGFIRFKLNQHFFHKLYAEVVTTAALSNGQVGTPKGPYAPVISEISLDYSSVHETDFTTLSKKDYDDRVEQLFHIRPFGINEFFPVDGVSDEEVFTSKILVPASLVNEKDEETGDVPINSEGGPLATDAEGSLYIGIENLEPGQNLAILFQVAEGSENPEKEKQEVIWSYLSSNRWIDFDITEILSENTNGLLTSGIVKFTMPKTMTSENSVLPSGKYWIRASVARESDAVCKIIAILPQAIKATFSKSEENDLERLKEPLAEKSVNKLKIGQAAIKKVLQPFASFNGKVEEMPASAAEITGDDRFNKEHNEYYIRISERLRHKGRGITVFDYERLVLQQFPEVYKVKCVNHTSNDSEHHPGHVTIVAIPDLRNKNAVDPLEPRLSLNKLEEIADFLKTIISDFVELDVRNPAYEEVQVSFNVKFLPGKDKGFYTNKLQGDIQRFLTPWLYDEGKDLILGGSVHRSAVLNFIEETDYVDFLTDFKMLHKDADGVSREVEEARASTSSSALVSGKGHIINFDINVECLK